MSDRISTYTQDLEKIVEERTDDFRKSEEKYRLIFQESQNGILLTNPSGRLLDINLAGIKLLGPNSKKEALEAVNVAALFINLSDWSSVRDQIRRSGLVRDFETQLQVREASTIEA